MAFQLNSNSTALILAAGYGTRLKPLTNHIPKALIEVNGIAMITRICAQIQDAGIKQIAINTHYLSDILTQYVNKLIPLFPSITFHLSYEPKLLDVGGGIRKVAKDLEVDELLIFNCDSFIYDHTHPLTQILDIFDIKKMDALVYLKRSSQDPSIQLPGDFNVAKNSKLERLDDPFENRYNYTGISIFKTKPLIEIDADEFHIMIDYLFPQLKSEHKFYGILAPFKHIDIGTLPDLKQARDIKIP